MAVNYPITEGFDNYSAPADVQTRDGDFRWSQVGTLNALLAGRYGGQALRVGGGSGAVIGVIGQPLSHLFNGMAVNLSGVATNNIDAAQLVVGDGTTSGGGVFATFGWQFVIALNPTLGQIQVITGTGSWFNFVSGGGAPVFTSANGLFPPNSWFFFEWEIIFSGGTATFNAWVNNIQVVAATGLALNPSGAGTAGIFVYQDTAFQTGSWLVDDVYFNSAAGSPYPGRLKDGYAPVFYPTSNSAVAWTSSTANPNYQNVNGQTQIAHNNNSQTPGQIDLFNVGGVPLGTIKAVSVKGQSSKNGAAPRTMSWLLKSSAVLSTSPAVGLNSSASVSSYQANADPNTGIGWTTANLNAALIGYEEQS